MPILDGGVPGRSRVKRTSSVVGLDIEQQCLLGHIVFKSGVASPEANVPHARRANCEKGSTKWGVPPVSRKGWRGTGTEQPGYGQKPTQFPAMSGRALSRSQADLHREGGRFRD